MDVNVNYELCWKNQNKVLKKRLLELFFVFLKMREVEGGILGIITAVLQSDICMQEGPARGNIWGASIAHHK